MLIRRHNNPTAPARPMLVELHGIADLSKIGAIERDASDQGNARSDRALSPILLEMERWLSATGMSASRFGRLAANDPRLVYDLRNGRDPSSRIVARLRAFMEAEASENL
ncbi:hypothetical protein D0Z70_22550 [Sphingobium terrigena]|uniref:Uncharacterized protein n=2 Tax=Sphingobium terrigena TaxID=2304063 RepID=A0A418YLF4_9SPHN|nr:hypothetical protein D0Z70_22550 [Sphingobium terrigena]